MGLDQDKAKRVGERALKIAVEASSDPVARWILAPRPDAASEQRWAGVTSNGVQSVQVDRVFRAGQNPCSEGTDAWWIVDYKTAHAEGAAPDEALPQLRSVFAPQLEAYARVLRGLHGGDSRVIAGLYYPRMKKFDWWEL
jgi:hypothetical protein